MIKSTAISTGLVLGLLGAAGLIQQPAATAQAPAQPEAAPVGMCAAGTGAMPNDLASQPMWSGWGADPSNARFQNAKSAGLTAADVPKLTLKWAFAFTATGQASGQPAVAGGRVFVGNQNATFQSLDLRTGCTYWQYKAEAGIRTAPSVARVTIGGTPRTIVMFGDFRANAYALDAQTGADVWKTKVDDHPFARVSCSADWRYRRLAATRSPARACSSASSPG
jgi:polyvinyl alcohol dehydrogenase (cytochrome)